VPDGRDGARDGNAAAPGAGDRAEDAPERRRTTRAGEELGDDEYEFEEILDHRRAGRGYQFLVRWLGFGPEYDTWEPSRYLPKVVVQEYLQRHGL